MNNTTPEGFRTAAYLEAKARLDARKTTRNIQCNPPNVRCGNRCIPPSWDCRLKGQGTDPHLRAVKTDPLGGLANIQRGFGRITRGVVKGNFSEVEGGKRAIIRGAVKVTPGNIQQKKELQKKLEERTRAIGIGLAVVTGGLGIHAILMKSNTFGYRYGVGRQLNEAVHKGVSAVLDATPILRTSRAQARIGALSSVSEAVTRAARTPQAGSEGLAASLESNSPEALRHLQNLNIGDTNRDSSSNLASAIRGVNKETRESKSTNIYAWDDKHRQAFWGAKVNAPDLDSKFPSGVTPRISVFARPAAEDFLVKHYNLPIESGGSSAGSTAIKNALATKLIEEKESHVAYAKQLGFRIAKVNKEEVIHRDDLNSYILRLNQNSGITGSTQKAIKDSADAHIAQLMTGKSLSTRAADIYADTVIGFNKLYGEVADKVKSVPGVASPSEGGARQRVAQTKPEGTQRLLASLDRVRVGEMARQLGHPRSGITGEAHAELVKSAYFANRVARSERNNRATYFITDRLARSVASELSGRPISQTGEAFRLLQSEHGFGGASRMQSARAANAGEVSIPISPNRPARRRLRSRSELIRTLTQGGLSAEAAAAEADRIISRRGDEDDFSPELVRTATYLAARADFKEGGRLGKPCGASHIPKAYECRKGRGASTPESGQSSSRVGATATVVAAGAALTIGGLLAYKQRQSVVPSLSKSAIDAMSSAQVKAGLDKLPERFQGQARQLVGGAKSAAAYMALKAQGGQIRAVDVKNNFSTWEMPNGTQMSVGSVGDSLLTFGAERKGNVSKFPQYGLGFTIDSSYDSKGGMPGAQAKQLIRTTKAMYQAQLEMLPENAVMFAVPHKADGKGGKRKSIYEGMGFKPIPGLKTERLWALKNQGKFTEIPDAQMEYMAGLIRGDAANWAKPSLLVLHGRR